LSKGRFFSPTAQKKEQGFDKLSPNGYASDMNVIDLSDGRVLDVRFTDGGLRISK